MLDKRHFFGQRVCAENLRNSGTPTPSYNHPPPPILMPPGGLRWDPYQCYAGDKSAFSIHCHRIMLATDFAA